MNECSVYNCINDQHFNYKSVKSLNNYAILFTEIVFSLENKKELVGQHRNKFPIFILFY